MKACTMVLSLLLVCSLYGQGLHHMEGGASRARYAGIGATPSTEAAMYGNIAAINTVSKWSVDAGYTQRYLLARLRTMSLSGVVHTDYGNVGLVISHYGFEALSESSIGLAYGRVLYDYLSIAAQVSTFRIQAGSYGTTMVYSGKAGILLDVSPTLTLGTYIQHPVSSGITEEQHYNTRFAVGLQYRASQKVSCMAEAYKQSGYDLELRAAISYDVIDALQISVGSEVMQGAIALGIRYRLANTAYVSTAYTYDQILGSTPTLSLGYGR